MITPLPSPHLSHHPSLIELMQMSTDPLGSHKQPKGLHLRPLPLAAGQPRPQVKQLPVQLLQQLLRLLLPAQPLLLSSFPPGTTHLALPQFCPHLLWNKRNHTSAGSSSNSSSSSLSLHWKRWPLPASIIHRHQLPHRTLAVQSLRLQTQPLGRPQI